MGVSRDEVRLGYQILFDREPESDDAYDVHTAHGDVSVLRSVLMGSEEGQAVLRAALADARATEYPADSYDREAVCHIHVEKTGGTSLAKMLAQHFEPSRCSPTHRTNVFGMTLLELSRYDFFSSHIDYFTSLLFPRASVKRICLFREPTQRLISFYRFHRAHPATHAEMNRFVHLAHRLSPVEFFEHKDVGNSPRLNNVYLRTFGTGLYGGAEIQGSAFELAASRIRSLDGLGLTSRALQSFSQIFGILGLPAPTQVQVQHCTDDLSTSRPGFAPGSQVELTPRLRDALRPLVRYDRILYETAVAEFESRMLGGQSAHLCSTPVSTAP